MDISFPALADGAQILGANYLRVFPTDLVRYLIGAGGIYLIVNLVLARALAGRKIRAKSPDGRQMRREFAASMRTVAIFAFVGAAFVLGGLQAGIISIDDGVHIRGWLYFAFNLTALIVLHDAWFYWTHRLIHHPKLFRRCHRLHHKSHNPSPWTAYSFDTAEAVLNAIYLPIALLIVPTSAPALGLFLLHMILRNAVGHCGYELFPSRRDGRPLFGWMTTVTHHDLHHAQAGWNYGLYFTWWDRLMGTEHPLYHEKFATAIRKPLDGSAVAARKAPLVAALALTIAAATFAAAPKGLAGPAAGPTPQGVYATEGHGAHVVFEPCAEAAETLCGRMVWAWDPKIELDPEAYLLGGFRWNGEVWREGWLDNPEDGRTYRGRIAPRSNGTLELKGCALVFCKSQIWRRVEEIPGCAAAKYGRAA